MIGVCIHVLLGVVTVMGALVSAMLWRISITSHRDVKGMAEAIKTWVAQKEQ